MPILNVVVLLRIVGRPIWWVFLIVIPCLGPVFLFVVMVDLARSFGKSAVFGLGLGALGGVFFPVLGFGDAKYLGPYRGGRGKEDTGEQDKAPTVAQDETPAVAQDEAPTVAQDETPAVVLDETPTVVEEMDVVTQVVNVVPDARFVHESTPTTQIRTSPSGPENTGKPSANGNVQEGKPEQASQAASSPPEGLSVEGAGVTVDHEDRSPKSKWPWKWALVILGLVVSMLVLLLALFPTDTGSTNLRVVAAAKGDRAAIVALSVQCQAGDEGVCHKLGLLYEKGQGVQMDTEEAIQLYRQACAVGHSGACSSLEGLESK